MKFSRHVNFAILRCAYFATLKFRDFEKICILNHFNFAFLSKTQLTFPWKRCLKFPLIEQNDFIEGTVTLTLTKNTQ